MRCLRVIQVRKPRIPNWCLYVRPLDVELGLLLNDPEDPVAACDVPCALMGLYLFKYLLLELLHFILHAHGHPVLDQLEHRLIMAGLLYMVLQLLLLLNIFSEVSLHCNNTHGPPP